MCVGTDQVEQGRGAEVKDQHRGRHHDQAQAEDAGDVVAVEDGLHARDHRHEEERPAEAAPPVRRSIIAGSSASGGSSHTDEREQEKPAPITT